MTEEEQEAAIAAIQANVAALQGQVAALTNALNGLVNTDFLATYGPMWPRRTEWLTGEMLL